jgi:hypothetical protein
VSASLAESVATNLCPEINTLGDLHSSDNPSSEWAVCAYFSTGHCGCTIAGKYFKELLIARSLNSRSFRQEIAEGAFAHAPRYFFAHAGKNLSYKTPQGFVGDILSKCSSSLRLQDVQGTVSVEKEPMEDKSPI